MTPRDKNDDNRQYTMADAVFSACFLNAMNRNCDIVGMANFAPILNTRGCIFTTEKAMVLRSTYYVFDLYVNYLGDTVLDSWWEEMPGLSVNRKDGEPVRVDTLDLLGTKWTDREGYALALVNKHPEEAQTITISMPEARGKAVLFTLNGPSRDSYNDVDRQEIQIQKHVLGMYQENSTVTLPPHSVNVLQIGVKQ